MKIRTKAAFFFLASAILLLAILVLYLQYFARAKFHEVVVSNLKIIEQKEMGVYAAFIDGLKVRTLNWSSDNHIKEFVQIMADPALSSLQRKAAADGLGAYLRDKKMRYDPTVLIAEILDQNGIIIASSRTKRIGINERKEEVEHFAHNFSKTITANFGEVFVKSAVFEDDEDTRPMFHLTVRMFRTDLDTKGNPIPLPAVLLVHFVSLPQLAVFLTHANELFPSVEEEGSDATVKTFKTLETYLVNKDYFIVTPSRDITGITKKRRIATKPVTECLTSGREIAEEYLDYRDVPVVGASVCLVEDGLVIVNEIETGEAYVIFDDLIRKTIFSGAVLLILGVLTIMFFMRFPLKRIDEIISVLERVTKGDLNVEAKVDSKDETGVLATMFNKMVVSIRQNQDVQQESKRALEKQGDVLRKDILEHEEQQKFLEQSKSATLNLLEDSLETKQKLEEEGSRLRTILASIEDGVIFIDIEYKIILVNPKALEIFAMPLAELLGKDLREVTKICKKKVNIEPGEWPTEEVFITKKAITTTLADNFCITTKGKETQIPVTFSIAPLSGKFSGIVIVIRDITLDRELDEAKSGFISVASHQLRTPLTSIRWYSEMLLSQDAGPLNESQKDFMNEIHGGAERLYQTVDLLLGISRVESGKLKADRTPIDLGVFTSAIKKELASQIEEKDLALTIVPPEREPVIVWLDSLTLRQVVLNLISNAIRYTNEKGIIEVKWWLGENGEEVVYMVHDNGIGIPESVRGHIFSKFFRAENARTQVPDGSGLGLALVKDLVESWNGKVWFESFPGQGTTFFFTVPLTSKIGLPVVEK